eukprot:235353_1
MALRDHYMWRITDSSTVNTILDKNEYSKKFVDSPLFTLFGCTWHLRFYYSGSYGGNIYVYLNSANGKNIAKNNVLYSWSYIKAKIALSIEEAKAQAEYSGKWDSVGSYGGGAVMSCSSLKKLDVTAFTIKLTMDILYVYSEYSGNITHVMEKKMGDVPKLDVNYRDTVQRNAMRLDSLTIKMEEMMKNMSTMQNTLKDISLKMNEEKKENSNNNNLQQQIDEMNKILSKLLMNNSNANNED